MLSASGKSSLKRKQVHVLLDRYFVLTYLSYCNIDEDDGDCGTPITETASSHKRLRSLVTASCPYHNVISSPLLMDSALDKETYVREQTATRRYISECMF
ncbi:hypothetical protein PTI98_004478 [Pleurotus ostreatus]|nr:hypothetical protein PTI98_004478 [Pleurotus ostreatus]